MSEKELVDYFSIEPAGDRLSDLDTPVPVVDLDIAERNIIRWQEHCQSLGLANRPHIKTHKLVGLARFQIDQGAAGITVQKLGEADVMAAAGIRDMLLTFNLLGAPKLRRLAELARRADLTLVADNSTVVAGLGDVGRTLGRGFPVLVECDTGAGRNGVQTPQAAVELAQLIDKTGGVDPVGLMTYPAPGTRDDVEAFLLEARDLAAASGLDMAVLSTGGSPDMWQREGLSAMTEYRAGTYVYSDRSLVNRGTSAWEDCALSVLSTVVSTPTADRAIIDAGSKALTMDLLGLEGYGEIAGHPDCRIYDLNEEHGYVRMSDRDPPLRVGDQIRVIPNHVCPVSNLYDQIVLCRGASNIGAVRVDARGTVQ